MQARLSQLKEVINHFNGIKEIQTNCLNKSNIEQNDQESEEQDQVVGFKASFGKSNRNSTLNEIYFQNNEEERLLESSSQYYGIINSKEEPSKEESDYLDDQLDTNTGEMNDKELLEEHKK